MSIYHGRLIILALCGVGTAAISRYVNRSYQSGNMPLFFGLIWGAAILFALAAVMLALIIRSRRHPEEDEVYELLPFGLLAKAIVPAVLAIGSVAGLMWLGRNVLADRFVLTCRILSLLLAGLVLLLFLIEIVTATVNAKKLERMSVREVQQYVLDHREEAEKKFAEKQKLLNRMHRLFDLQDLMVGLMGAGAAFLFGGASPGWDYFYVPFALLCAAIVYSALLGIRLPVSRKEGLKGPSDLEKKDFPKLFAVAERAMKTIGVKGDFCFAVEPGASASLEFLGNFYRLHIGYILLYVLSEEEFYNVLLHEFAHAAKENENLNRLTELKMRLAESKVLPSANRLFRLTHAFYPFFFFHFRMYVFAGSLALEYASDRAAAEHGDAKALISALFKIKYYELFTWEAEAYDHPPVFAPETAEEVNEAADDLKPFLARMAERKDFWDQLIQKELPSRGASHPTVKMRAEALGVSGTETLPPKHDETYAKEVKRASETFEKQFTKSLAEQLLSLRKEHYLDHLERVTKWEEEGKPLDPVNYPDMLGDLRSLGRVTDALELCDRVLAECSVTTQALAACFVKGTLLLHRFDEAGVELLYKAIENNSNYIDSGMDTLGYYFCQTGRREELEEYREKALKKAEEQNDLYAKMEYLAPGDNLIPESLPEGRLDDILHFIESIAEGFVEEVFLVRKVVTDEFFFSPFIIRFTSGLGGKKRREIMHQIFNYLDNCPYDWQYALFDYDEIPKTQQVIRGVKGSSVWRKE
ncbi:MAG: hypothetical protein J6112_06340 [Clostridia bacterium]|nr:hypothetical protein [Clostridia bacterium]